MGRFAFFLILAMVSVPGFTSDLENCGLSEHELAWNANPDGTPISFKGFVDQVQGTYKIAFANNHKPKPDNAEGEVVSDSVEATITVPYCAPGGVCDPGYLYFPWNATQAFEKQVAPGNSIVTLLVSENGRVDRFTWENKAGQVTFRNHQYRLSNGNVIVMIHVMTKS